MSLINLTFPPQFNIISIKKKNNLNVIFYCYNKKTYFKFSAKHFYLNDSLNSIIIVNQEMSINNFYKKFFENFLKSLDCYFFMKIQFKGKGYKIKYKRRKKKITFFFGHSHITIIKYKGIILKKYVKYKYLIKSNNLETLKKNVKLTTNVKKINIFTSRGLRPSRCILYKRKGKKSTHV